jgi:hypothetical protein
MAFCVSKGCAAASEEIVPQNSRDKSELTDSPYIHRCVVSPTYNLIDRTTSGLEWRGEGSESALLKQSRKADYERSVQ